jgi:dihydrofolate synthase / folylpolyglutamate synthase
MTYKETIDYLFTSAPLFQQLGGKAYKEGLSNTLALDEHFSHPHTQFRSIHIAGTNGKGSCSHIIAAILQAAGYRVGLYTSPHLIDFRERIRVNGQPVTEKFVINFIENERSFFEPLHPSFFELTTAMAFYYFASQKVDIAVIEVGLGGRLDCTNIINPILSIITNISFDHTQFLGNTLAKIASEKAGIIKRGVPVVIGETTPETLPIFKSKAKEMNAPIYWAEEDQQIRSSQPTNDGGRLFKTKEYKELTGELGGLCQEKNANTIICAIKRLKDLHIIGTHIDNSQGEDVVRKGFKNVCEMTGLMGRWQRLGTYPTIICDTGHNVGGWLYISEQLKNIRCKTMHIIIGMVNDKDINSVMAMMPKGAVYYFTKANVKRARNEKEVKTIGESYGLTGECYQDVKSAYKKAIENADKDDFIFVGGSSFIVADLLSMLF